MTEIVQNIIIWAPGILFAITLHEWAHGRMAAFFGDPTPGLMGRLTLNPIPHIDLAWTIVIPGVMLLVSLLTTGTPFVFGGAKPVPIDPRYFIRAGSSLRNSLFWVAAAGPFMNLFLALLCALSFRLVAHLPEYFMVPLANMLVAAIQMNVLLAVFNLLPIPPLDGGRMIGALLPNPFDTYLAALERFGMPIVLVLAFSGMLAHLLIPAMSVLNQFYLQLAGLV
ncbi:MAG: site-2 protease family protein [Magnetococcales bacterium]|nr:site-2 protease family protein [Magnetococcales bacterium]MBF0439540.1 site-2 protease family protein [Magnetococcales bacterium]